MGYSASARSVGVVLCRWLCSRSLELHAGVFCARFGRNLPDFVISYCGPDSWLAYWASGTGCGESAQNHILRQCSIADPSFRQTWRWKLQRCLGYWCGMVAPTVPLWVWFSPQREPKAGPSSWLRSSTSLLAYFRLIYPKNHSSASFTKLFTLRILRYHYHQSSSDLHQVIHHKWSHEARGVVGVVAAYCGVPTVLSLWIQRRDPDPRRWPV